jgi:hypothetical protein
MNNTSALAPLWRPLPRGRFRSMTWPAPWRDAAQEHEPALPDRYLDVLERLLNQLESSALFSEESCSFSRTDMVAASWSDWLPRRGRTIAIRAPTRD